MTISITDFNRGRRCFECLDGVSLTVEEGEFIAVVGTSGCGKTTLMNMLGGLDIPDFGGVWIRNK